MTFEVLNETTILVELTFEEMKKYHITYETLDSNNNAIKNILNVIKASDKIDTSEKITIEALPVNDGGCFFILTFTPKKKVRYKMRKLSENSVFKTDNIDNLLDFVSALKVKHQKNLKYEIYKMNESFYMQIPERSQKLQAVMGEFGQISDIVPEKINEHGVLLGSIII
ncbi:MAG: adaptor protein MecA [Ruminococcaceae bacterium]|nr:adaptor protein MecA [Oscillospiraceae bacterium]